MFEELLNEIGPDSLHRFSIDWAHRRLPNPIYGKHGRLYCAVAVVKFETGVGLYPITTALQASFVGPVTNAHVREFHCDSFGTVGEHVQVDCGIFIGGSDQHRTNEAG